MKKVLVVLLVIITALLAVACKPMIQINYYGEDWIEFQRENRGLYNGPQPPYTIDGMAHVAAPGFNWANHDETIVGGHLLYLGKHDSIDNWKQIPEYWR